MNLNLQPEYYREVSLRTLVLEILDSVSLATMSTINQDGTSHINTAFFCIDSDLRMFFVSKKDTQHVRNIQERPTMAVAVFDSNQDWDDWKTGLQLFGWCEIANKKDTILATRLYGDRFPAYAKWLDEIGRCNSPEISPPIFVFVPKSLKILHEKRLGEENFISVNLLRNPAGS